MGFGSETTNKGTTTSLAPSLSKDETLQLFFNNKKIQSKLQDLLQEDDRVIFHSEMKLDRIFKIVMLACLSLFIFSLLIGFSFLFFSLILADDSIVDIPLFSISIFSCAVVDVVSSLVLPVRNTVILTRNSLIIINSMLILPNKVMKFSDLSRISKIVGSTRVKVAPGQPEVTGENINSLVCEDSIQKKDGFFEVVLGPQTARFSVNGADDLIEAFTNFYDTPPTISVISEKWDYLKATLFYAGFCAFSFLLAVGAMWIGNNYERLPSLFFNNGLSILFIVFFLCFSLAQDRKYQVDHTFNPN